MSDEILIQISEKLDNIGSKMSTVENFVSIIALLFLAYWIYLIFKIVTGLLMGIWRD